MSTKIVITGGPSGGKTTLIETLKKDLGNKITVVPEAASILYRGGFPRTTSDLNHFHGQRAICFIQRELEDLARAESRAEIIICDRGSLDSIAYWPGSAENFFTSLNTTLETELKRYQWVIHLDTASPDSFDTTNPIRTESFAEAMELNEKTKLAWQNHPQRIIIPHETEFLTKITRAKLVLEKIITGASYSEVQHAFALTV
jgi:predicted ATPase